MRGLRAIAAVVLLSGLGAPVQGQDQGQGLTAKQRQLLGPMADDLARRVGVWDVRADLQLQPGARKVTIMATAHGKLIGGRWLVTELKGADQGRGMVPFEGLGVNGYDPVQKKYVGYWVDGSRGVTVPVEGVYDARSKTFRTISVEVSADGRRTVVHSETKPAGPDSEVTTFTATDAKGQPYTRMILTYTRSKQQGSNLKSTPAGEGGG